MKKNCMFIAAKQIFRNRNISSMRTIYIVRHAKSSWGDVSLPDYDRPLNDRGKKDAPEMAIRLKEKGVSIDAFISSPAKRAKKTARLFCEEFNVNENKIILIDELYHAGEQTFYKVIAEMDDKSKSIALFSHNPGITDFVNSLCNGVTVYNMPTCGVFAIKVKTESWKDFKSAEKKFLFFDYPKLVTDVPS
jgi:phosphohistidine phosphatase